MKIRNVKQTDVDYDEKHDVTHINVSDNRGHVAKYRARGYIDPDYLAEAMMLAEKRDSDMGTAVTIATHPRAVLNRLKSTL